MRRPIYVLVSASAALIAAISSSRADNASFSNDLKATIALQGMPCDQIVDAKRNGDSDYTATCKDGNRYHVFVNPKGRVVVQKL
jgi:hypothetical protein